MILRSYMDMGAQFVTYDADKVNKMGIKVVEADVAKISANNVRHDPEKLANTISNVIMNDSKLKARTSILEYILTSEKKRHRESLMKSGSK